MIPSKTRRDNLGGATFVVATTWLMIKVPNFTRCITKKEKKNYKHN